MRPDMFAAVGMAYANTLKSMVAPAQCGKTIWQPFDGKWVQIRCPLTSPHKLHADENLYPFFTDADADWFNEQHRLATG